jgi:hypothetical protein
MRDEWVPKSMTPKGSREDDGNAADAGAKVSSQQTRRPSELSPTIRVRSRPWGMKLTNATNLSIAFAAESHL